MISALILSLTLQAAAEGATTGAESNGPDDPDVAVCEVLVGDSRATGDPPQFIQFDCPADAPDAGTLQTLANRLASQIDLDLERNQDVGYDTELTVRFRRGADGWAAEAGPPLIMAWVSFPSMLARYGKLFYCTYAVTPQTDGRGADPRMACVVGGRQIRRQVEIAEETTRLAIENMRWMPTDRPYCYQDDYAIELTIFVRGGPGIEGQELPDLNRLPLLCEQE